MDIKNSLLDILYNIILKKKALKKVKIDFIDNANNCDNDEDIKNAQNSLANVLSFYEWLLFVGKFNFIENEIKKNNNKTKLNTQYIYDIINSKDKKPIFTAVVLATMKYNYDTLININITTKFIEKLSKNNQNLYYGKLSEYTHNISKECVTFPVNEKNNQSMSVELNNIAVKYRR